MICAEPYDLSLCLHMLHPLKSILILSCKLHQVGTDYWLDDQAVGLGFLTGTEIRIAVSVSSPASGSTLDFVLGRKRPGKVVDYSAPSSVEIKNARVIPPCVFIPWCLIKYWDTSALLLHLVLPVRGFD